MGRKHRDSPRTCARVGVVRLPPIPLPEGFRMDKPSLEAMRTFDRRYLGKDFVRFPKGSGKTLKHLTDDERGKIAAYCCYVDRHDRWSYLYDLADWLVIRFPKPGAVVPPKREPLHGESALSYATRLWTSLKIKKPSPPAWFQQLYGASPWMFRCIPTGQMHKALTLLVRLSWASRCLGDQSIGRSRMVEASLNRYSVRRVLRSAAKNLKRVCSMVHT